MKRKSKERNRCIETDHSANNKTKLEDTDTDNKELFLSWHEHPITWAWYYSRFERIHGEVRGGGAKKKVG